MRLSISIAKKEGTMNVIHPGGTEQAFSFKNKTCSPHF